MGYAPTFCAASLSDSLNDKNQVAHTLLINVEELATVAQVLDEFPVGVDVKEKRKYHYEDMMTPFEKLLSLPRPSQYLKSGITLKTLNAFAAEMTDNENLAS